MAKCYICNNIVSHDEIGLNKKFLGRLNEKYMCIVCLAKYFNTNEEVLKSKIIEFKKMGCTLF